MEGILKFLYKTFFDMLNSFLRYNKSNWKLLLFSRNKSS